MKEELKEIGLSEYEIKVYLTLLRMGNLNSGKLSKESNVPQSKIYESLYKLSNKGFVSIIDTRPKIFSAINVKKAVNNYLNIKKNRFIELEKLIPEKFNQRIVNHKNNYDEENIKIYRGKKYTNPLILDKFLNAKKYIKEMLTFEYIPFSVQREIKNCVKKGIKIKMIATKRNKDNLSLIKEIAKMGVKIKYFPLNEIRIAIKDGEESIQMILNSKNLEDRTSIMINSKELTKALEHYFDYLWEKADNL